MPVYQYIAQDESKGCDTCRSGFEIKQGVNDEPLATCPECGDAIRKVFPNVVIGPSKTGLDRRAKESGFHKLKKVDKGKYEKLY